MARAFDGCIRVSRVGDRTERLRSPSFQEREIRAEARKRGLALGRIISDLDQSGGKDDRPGLLEAIRRIEAGESAGIIVAKLDRFSRNLTQATALAQRIMDAGGRIYSFAEPADWTTSDGELQINLALAIAQHQRRRANDYFESAKASAIERGIPVNPRIAPGYVRNPETGRLIVNHDAAETVREVFERRATGAGPSALGDLLESRGLRTSMGSAAWSKQAVYGLLRNRIYLGELRYAGYVNAESHEPIVDRATFEAAQLQVAKLQPSKARRPSLLTGMIRCWACRYALQATTSSRGKPIYRCTRRHAAGRCPEPARIDAMTADEFVLAALQDQVKRGPAMQSVDDAVALDEASSLLRTAEDEVVRYRDDIKVREVLGREVWLDGLRKRRNEVREAEDLLAKRRLATPQTVPDLRVLADELDDMAVAEQREVLAIMVDCVALRSATSQSELFDRIVVFWAGAGPVDLPRRGFREKPQLRSFQLPPGSAVSVR